MTSVPVREPPLSRSGLWDELDRTLEHYGTKGVVVDLKVWIIGLVLVVMLNVVGTAGLAWRLCSLAMLRRRILLLRWRT